MIVFLVFVFFVEIYLAKAQEFQLVTTVKVNLKGYAENVIWACQKMIVFDTSDWWCFGEITKEKMFRNLCNALKKKSRLVFMRALGWGYFKNINSIVAFKNIGFILRHLLNHWCLFVFCHTASVYDHIGVGVLYSIDIVKMLSFKNEKYKFNIQMIFP